MDKGQSSNDHVKRGEQRNDEARSGKLTADGRGSGTPPGEGWEEVVYPQIAQIAQIGFEWLRENTEIAENRKGGDMILTRGLGRVPVWRHTDEVLLWRSRVLGVGGTAGFRTMQYLDKFVIDCREAGVWSVLKEVLPLAGDNLGAALVKLKVLGAQTSAFAFNFVEGDYSEATGLLGNGTTKHLDLNTTAANVGSSFFGLATYNREDTTGASIRYAVGVTDATDNYLIGSNNPAAACAGYMGGGAAALPATPYTKGFYYVERSSSSSLKMYRDNVELAANVATVATANPTINFFAFAKNNNGGGAANFLNTRLSFIALTGVLTDEQRGSLFEAVRTLQVNLGRAV